MISRTLPFSMLSLRKGYEWIKHVLKVLGWNKKKSHDPNNYLFHLVSDKVSILFFIIFFFFFFYFNIIT